MSNRADKLIGGTSDRDFLRYIRKTLPQYGSFGSGGSGGGSGTGVNVTQALTDATTINWDYSLGNIATVTIGGNRTLAISNVTAGTFGLLKLKQDGVGSRGITLPGFKKSGFATSTGAAQEDLLGFYYDGINFYWTIENYGTAGYTVENLVWYELANATTAGSGTLSVTAVNHGGTGTNNGGTANKRLLKANGNYVEYVLSNPLSGCNGAVLALGATNDQNYKWSTNTPIVTLSAVYNFNGTIYVQHGDSSAATANTPPNINVVSGITSPTAADIIRMEISGNDILVRRSSNGGSTFTTYYTFTGYLASYSEVYIKGLFAVDQNAELLNARGYGLV